MNKNVIACEVQGMRYGAGVIASRHYGYAPSVFSRSNSLDVYMLPIITLPLSVFATGGLGCAVKAAAHGWEEVARLDDEDPTAGYAASVAVEARQERELRHSPVFGEDVECALIVIRQFGNLLIRLVAERGSFDFA